MPTTGGDGGPDTGNVDTTGGEGSGSSSAAQTDSSGGGSSEGSSGSESGEESGTTTGGGVEGVCIGFDQVATVNTVFGLEGANPGGNCDSNPAPCGGDIVGDWEIDDSCGQEDIPSPFECDQQEWTVEVLDQMGNIEFVDDGTFSQSVMTSTMFMVVLDPMECFDFNCAAFEAQLQGSDPGWTCQLDKPDCECDLVTMADNTIDGTWETNGNVVTLTVEDVTQDIDYCVNGNRLDFWQGVNDVTVTRETCVDEAECMDALGDTHESYVCLAGDGG